MVKSMTGYGNASGSSGELAITVEVRSVNNRYLDCSIRIPRIYTAFEDAIKENVQKYISRGKVDVYVTIDTGGASDMDIRVNESLADAYFSALTGLADKYGLSRDFSVISFAKLPDILTLQRKEADAELLKNDICRILCEALDGFTVMRKTEGNKLFEDISSRLVTIEKLVGRVEERSPETVREYRARLTAKMRDVLQDKSVDENRLLLEAALYADKIAVSEETVRLRSHIAQFRSIMQSGEPVGRKLDFLVQEFNREANTIGSKCSDASLARVVVDIKAEIEKIREQIQNIE